MSFEWASASNAQTRCVGASPRNSLVSEGNSGSSFISCYDALVRGGVVGEHSGDLFAADEPAKGLGRQVFAGQHADHPVSNARRQDVGPLLDRLVSDPNGHRSTMDRTAQQLDSFNFFHTPLEHSSVNLQSIVQQKFAMVNPMTEYRERLRQAMGASVSIAQLACALDVSYQAVKKLLDGKSTSFTAINNTKAARFLGVNPDWLATGTGEMMAQYVPEPETDGLSVLAEKLSYLDTASRETAATLLAGMARDPAGPWAGWLAELLTGKQGNSLQGDVTLPDKNKESSELKLSSRGKPKNIFNLGEYDGEQGKRSPGHEHHSPKHAQK